MPYTAYAPTAQLTAGYTIIGDSPAIANINAPTVAELTSATTYALQCALQSFGASTTVSKTTRKMICDKVGKESVGSRTYTMDTMTIMAGDLQTANAYLTGLALDSVHYFWVRPGKADSVAVAATDKVMVVKAKIDSVDLRTISNADGDEFAIVVNVSVQDRTQLLGTVAA